MNVLLQLSVQQCITKHPGSSHAQGMMVHAKGFVQRLRPINSMPLFNELNPVITTALQQSRSNQAEPLK